MSPQDEVRLNDWIEGVAGEADAAIVERLLETRSDLRAVAEAMRADRERLVQEPVPAVPEALRASIHAAVDRELLAPTVEVSAWRDRHRSGRRLPWRRLAVAAGFVLVSGVSLGIVLSGGGGTSDVGPEQPLDPESLVADAGDAVPFEVASGDRIVHALPSSIAMPRTVVEATGGDPADLEDVGGERIVPALRLVADRTELERTLATLASDDGPALAVTRNLTVAALRQASATDDPLLASLGNAIARGNDSVANWDRRAGAALADRAAADAGAAGRVIAGAEASMPGWGDQIAYSEAGATWTVTVTAGRLEAMLAAITAATDREAEFVAVDRRAWTMSDDAGTWREMRARLRAIAAADPEAVVRVPILHVP